MSAEVEEQLRVVEPEEDSSAESSKKPMRSYTREFLLSLSELEICKKLPKGFDESLLSEFQETSYYGSQDRPRVLGSSPLQAFRRNDYGSSPPARGDSGGFSRGLQRWDSRSSGKSEGDSDSESGRRFGNPARRTWQNSEHDGLLGSGSFPRPPGYAAGSAAPRFRPNESLQLNKSNEPYQPPRPYKAGPHSRRETNDSCNDETFGSSDSTSEDRAEEERKRKAEFESMRMEQLKFMQENQKLNPGKPKDAFSEMVGLLEKPSDSKISSDLHKVLKETPHEDSSKVSVSAPAPPARPLVPPGFVSGGVDKSSASKSHVHADALQVEKLEAEQGHKNLKSITPERDSRDWFGEMSRSSYSKAKMGVPSIPLGVDQARASSLPDVIEVLENGESLGLDSEISGHKLLGEPVSSTSLLDKLFSNGLAIASESTSNTAEAEDPKAEDMWSPDKLQSKFARWFREEDKRSPGNASSEKPNSLLSLIIGGEKGGSNGLNGVAKAPVLATEIMPGQNSFKSAALTGEVPDQFSSSNGPVPKASVLTCEDLEQSMLSEIGGDILKPRSPEKEKVTFEAKKGVLPDAPVDNSASQHLLSLLQGGISSNNPVSMFGVVKRQPDEEQELGKSGLPESISNTTGIRESNHADNSLTLEALFGTAFMKELHSAQKGSVASARIDVPDGGVFPPRMGQNGDGVGSHEGTILTSNDGISKLDKVGDWPDFQDSGKKVELPEEDTLINLIDPIYAENSVWKPNSSQCSADLRSLSSNSSVNVMEKLAALGGAVTDERSILSGQDPSFMHNPYDFGKPEMPYQNRHPQTSSPQHHTPPMNNSRTSFHSLDSHAAHIDPHMNFIPPDAVIHRDAPTHHQFPTNMGHPSFPHSSAGHPTFDHAIPRPALQQMHMAGNHPPPHLVRGFPGAAPMPPHVNHTPNGFIQEHNPMQGFPFAQRQPNFGGPGMIPPGPELGVANNTPEAFQRLLEMEMRANPKQIHPFATGSPNRAMYGHELDMGYRYR